MTVRWTVRCAEPTEAFSPQRKCENVRFKSHLRNQGAQRKGTNWKIWEVMGSYGKMQEDMAILISNHVRTIDVIISKFVQIISFNTCKFVKVMMNERLSIYKKPPLSIMAKEVFILCNQSSITMQFTKPLAAVQASKAMIPLP